MKFKHYFEVIIAKIIKFICNKERKTNLIDNFFYSYFFKYLLFISRDNISRESFEVKNKIINYISIYQRFNNKIFNLPTNDSDRIILKQINLDGISNDFNFLISKEETHYVNTYFKKSYFFDGHIPILKNKKKPSSKPTSAYISYDNYSQLNCLPILKICLNERILSIAQNYLNTFPLLFNVNTFKTIPNHEAFTHAFHRDIDNIKWLTFFIFWTNTKPEDGAFQQIKHTHQPSQNLTKIIGSSKTKLFSKDLNDFFKNTSYGKDEEYLKIFEKKDIVTSYGDSGKVIVADTFGLHRGRPVKNERLVTWIRYGVALGRQKKFIDLFRKKTHLIAEAKEYYENNKYKSVLEDIIEK